MTPAEIADLIADLRDYNTVAIAGGTLFSHPLSRALIQRQIYVPDQGTTHTVRMSHPHHVSTLDMSKFDEDFSARFNVMFTRSWPAFMILQVAEPVNKYLRSDKRPEFEFLRHVRNAVAHDNHFFIRKLPFPAHFDGYKITSELDGTPLWEFLQPGDLLALIDQIEATLRGFTA